MTQTEAVLERLQQGTLTQLQAYAEIGSTRLAARVEELRKQGHTSRGLQVLEPESPNHPKAARVTQRVVNGLTATAQRLTGTKAAGVQPELCLGTVKPVLCRKGHVTVLREVKYVVAHVLATLSRRYKRFGNLFPTKTLRGRLERCRKGSG